MSKLKDRIEVLEHNMQCMRRDFMERFEIVNRDHFTKIKKMRIGIERKIKELYDALDGHNVAINEILDVLQLNAINNCAKDLDNLMQNFEDALNEAFKQENKIKSETKRGRGRPRKEVK